jgi:pimeloyl-ACP methyl ester carboxylesterase
LGTIDYPVLLVCGELDEQVPGPEEQRRTTLAAFTRSTLEVIPNAGHLMPMQTPQALAKLMLTFAKEQCSK